MIIGISAGQGQGKSTLINEVCQYTSNEYENPPISKLNLQTSREALADWGYSLDEVNRYLPLKRKFQEELFERHCRALIDAQKESEITGSVYLVERTFSDIFAYTILGVGAFNDYSSWLGDYKTKCGVAQAQYFDKVVFLTGRDYQPEADGVRSINGDFSGVANYLIEQYTDEFSTPAHITTPDLKQRVETLHRLIADLRG